MHADTQYSGLSSLPTTSGHTGPNLNTAEKIRKRTRSGHIPLLAVLAIAFTVSACALRPVQMRPDQDQTRHGCWNRIRTADGDRIRLNRMLDDEIQSYQHLIEEFLVNRETTLKLIHGLDTDTVLSPTHLDFLHQRMKEALSNLGRLSALLGTHSCWIEATGQELAERGIAPLDPYIRTKGAMIALSAGLFLYDTYLSLVTVLNQNAKIRRYLNQKDIGYGLHSDQLMAITDEFISISNLAQIRDEIDFYEKSIDVARSQRDLDPYFDYLDLLIQSSPALPILREMPLQQMVGMRLESRVNAISDNLLRLNHTAVYGFSAVFGNTMGLVEIRRGHLYNRKDVRKILLQRLQPGDILLEKTPFRLTDKLIPGYWGHAAIWIGSEHDLRVLDLWENPLVRRYHNELSTQRGVAEALRSGTQLNTLTHFLNVDDLLVLRARNAGRAERARTIELALRQIGKPYDFNYNVETTDRIVCSQLVYLAYTGIRWPTREVIGRYTISPDNIAAKSLNDGPLEIVALYHDGRPVYEYRKQMLESLIGLEEQAD